MNGLVERALKTSNVAHRMTLSDVRTRIGRLTGLPSYPEVPVKAALKELVDRHRVDSSLQSRKGEVLYGLSENRFAELESASCESEALEDRVRGEIVRAVSLSHQSLSESDRKLVGDTFFALVGRILRAYGDHCAQSLLTIQRFDEHGYPGLGEELDNALQGLSRELKITTRRALREAIAHPSEVVKEYLYAAGQGYYMVGLLNLDPELQAVQRVRFEQTTVYLDTNLLVAALLPEHSSCEAALSLIGLCVEAGLQVRYSETTASEVERLLEAADNDYAAHPPLDPARATLLAPLVDNPFLQAWLGSWGEARLAWPQFRTRLSAWKGVLEHLGVSLDSGPDEIDVPRARTDAFRQALREADSKRPENRRRRASALKHDARMLGAIEMLLRQDDSAPHPFGGPFWFVTLDRGVVDAARQMLKAGCRHNCMLAEEWVHYIAPFVSPDISDSDPSDVFAKLLASRLFLSVGASLTLAELQPYTAPQLESVVEGLSTEELCEAVADTHAITARSRAEALRGQGLRVQGVDRFLSQVEKRIREKKAQGTLITSEQAHQLVEAQKDENARLNDELASKDVALQEVRADLADAARYRSRSLRYRARESSARFHLALTSIRRWANRHRIRAAVLAIGVIVATAASFLGSVGVIGGLVLLAATVVATVEPREALDNIRKWIGL
jgi:hypothetical protein